MIVWSVKYGLNVRNSRVLSHQGFLIIPIVSANFAINLYCKFHIYNGSYQMTYVIRAPEDILNGCLVEYRYLNIIFEVIFCSQQTFGASSILGRYWPAMARYSGTKCLLVLTLNTVKPVYKDHTWKYLAVCLGRWSNAGCLWHRFDSEVKPVLMLTCIKNQPGKMQSSFVLSVRVETPLGHQEHDSLPHEDLVLLTL